MVSTSAEGSAGVVGTMCSGPAVISSEQNAGFSRDQQGPRGNQNSEVLQRSAVNKIQESAAINIDQQRTKVQETCGEQQGSAMNNMQESAGVNRDQLGTTKMQESVLDQKVV